MLLYNTPLAPNPRRVRIFLAEKNVTIPARDVNLIAQEHKSDDRGESLSELHVTGASIGEGVNRSTSASVVSARRTHVSALLDLVEVIQFV